VSTFEEITALVEAIPDLVVFEGYPSTGAKVPYVVHRPLYIDVDANSASGEVIDWNYQTTLYACGGSVNASFNLALMLMSALQGAPVSGTTLSTSMGYAGAPVEGHYESQVTVQLNLGGI